MSETAALERRVDRLEQLVTELVRLLRASEDKAGRNAQTVRFIPSGG